MSSKHILAAPLLASVLLFNHASASDKAKPKAAAPDAGGWVKLFDGKLHGNLRGYKSEGIPENSWVIEDGALKTVPRSAGGKVVDLITVEQFADFEVEWEWKVAPGGNSGVMYRVAELDKGPAWHTGPEFQLLDDDKHPDGQNPKRRAGCLYDMIEPVGKILKPVGEFNHSRIVMRDNHVEHWVNGKKVLDYTWGSDELKVLVGRSKFAKLPGFMKQSAGHVAFQHHGEEFWLRNARIRKL